jgi:hypothetical protein
MLFLLVKGYSEKADILDLFRLEKQCMTMGVIPSAGHSNIGGDTSQGSVDTDPPLGESLSQKNMFAILERF